MTQSDVPELIQSFKDANKTLRKRAITIGVLMLLSIALKYMEYSRQENIFDLVNYQLRLNARYHFACEVLLVTKKGDR